MKIFNGTPSAFTYGLETSLDAPVEEWTTDRDEKERCDILLYVATSDLEGVSHIIDAVNDSNHWKEKTVFCTLFDEEDNGFNQHQKKSLIATGRMVRENKGHWFESKEALLQFLNARNAG